LHGESSHTTGNKDTGWGIQKIWWGTTSFSNNLNEPEDDSDNNDLVLQEACALAGSDVIKLEENNGIDLSMPALADLLCDKLTHNILDDLGSGGSVPSLVVDSGDENMKSFDLSNPLEF
jgi:hypothetical protein